MWTERDKFYWDKLMQWEQQLVLLEETRFDQKLSFSLEPVLHQLPEEISSRLFKGMDEAAEKLASFVQKPKMIDQVQQQIVTTARIFDESIESIEQLRSLTIDQLRYINSQQAGSSRLYSAAQGAYAGMGGALPVLSDLLAVIILNVRAVQITALSYGVNIHSPYEQKAALQVAQAALMPDGMKAESWQALLEEAEKVQNADVSSYLYGETASTIRSTWLQEQLPQLLKLTAAMALRTKKTSRLPVLSMTVSGAANYRLTKKVIDFAEHYYQYRYLSEKKSN